MPHWPYHLPASLRNFSADKIKVIADGGSNRDGFKCSGIFSNHEIKALSSFVARTNYRGNNLVAAISQSIPVIFVGKPG